MYLPYCSSDVFVGNFSSWGFLFRGQEIVRAAMAAVRALGFGQVGQLFVAGGPAGGRAAAFNIAAFADSFQASAVKGVFDSPLWLDIMPRYDSWPGSLGIAKFMLAVSGFAPLEECAAYYREQPHNCFITEYQLPFVRQPFFIASSVSDAFIVPMFVQARPPLDPSATAMAYNIRTVILGTLRLLALRRPDVAVFSLSCYEHATSLAEGFWGSVSSARRESMNDALFAWLANGRYFSVD